MRRTIVGGGVAGTMLLCGCLGLNPAWMSSGGTTEAEASTTAVVPTTTADATTTAASGAPTTSGSLSGSGSGDESSSGAPTTEALLTSTAATTGDDTTGGPPAKLCTSSETIPVDLAANRIEDAGLAPMSLVPCAWPGTCETLNFGSTEYFRMVATPELGKTVGLFRFNVGMIDEWLAKSGHDPMDLLGFEFELVIYEPRDLPAADATFQIDAPAQLNADYPEGKGTEDVATDGESSGACKSLEQQSCVAWAEGAYPSETSVKLGTIEVTAAAVQMHDYDGANNGVYHAKLRSSLLPADIIREVTGDGPPTFLVTLATPRGMAPGEEIGIKFQESPEPDPALHAVLCTEYNGG